MSSRIRISYERDEPLPANIFTDLKWLEENLQELYELLGRCTVIVYEKTIIGRGQSLEETLNDAELRLPKDVKTVTAIVADIHKPHIEAVLYHQPKISKL